MGLWVRVPTNIALIKYWGKQDAKLNWPCNDSVSMSLSSLTTTTTSEPIEEGYKVYFEDQLLDLNDNRYQRMVGFLDWIKQKEGFSGGLRIRTKNSFYSDCGIASSASGFSALTISSILSWTGFTSLKELKEGGFNLKRLTDISRIGSGSSCRSFIPGFAHWEKGTSFDTQSVEQIEDHGWNLSDNIVVISSDKKKVSSRQGHLLAESSPYFKQRLVDLQGRTQRILEAIDKNDIELLGSIIEEEAQSMHQVMETSGLSYRSRECMEFLDKFKNLRNSLGLKAYYTMDAGQCVHIISESRDKDRVKNLLEDNFNYEILSADIDRAGPVIFEAKE